ncbi:MAG TPA: MalM family protein [Oleiagrimonas sp.]|nr:MalM family protein [Oleiagrimonas sp.]
MMLFRALSRLGPFIALPLLLSACTTALPLQGGGQPGDDETLSLEHARKALTEAELCCTRFSQFDFSQALPSKPEPFTMGPKRPVADFNGARSWFLAFHLPPDMKLPYGILFKSTLTGTWLHHSYLFAPSVVLLNAAYQPLRVKDVQLCEYMGWTRATSGAFGHITVKNPDARYLVVYTSGNQLGSSTYWEQSPTAFSTTAPVQMASSGDFQITHGPNGELYVGKLTDQYRQTVEDAICGKPDDSGDGVISVLQRALWSDNPPSSTPGKS